MLVEFVGVSWNVFVSKSVLLDVAGGCLILFELC